MVKLDMFMAKLTLFINDSQVIRLHSVDMEQLSRYFHTFIVIIF